MNRHSFVGGEVLELREGTTQGDPLAMPMYALATVPLISKVRTEQTKQIWYADDAAAAADTIGGLRQWWNKLMEHGPAFDYLPNAKKSWLIVKEGNLDAAKYHEHQHNLRGEKLSRNGSGNKGLS